MFVSNGGFADGVQVNSLGRLVFSNGATLTGIQKFENGADVSALNGAVLNFNLLSASAGGTALVTGLSLIHGAPKYTLTVDDSLEKGTYLLAEDAKGFADVIEVGNMLGGSLGMLAVETTLAVDSTEYILTQTGSSLSLLIRAAAPSDVTPETMSWEKTADAEYYIVEYSPDNYEHVIRITTDSNSLDSFRMPAGNYKWRVKPENGEEWVDVEPVTVAEEPDNEPKLIKSTADGSKDVFFVNSAGIWEAGYSAKHMGATGDWTGTNERVLLTGKNKLSDIIEGSTDANILLMTDDDNGDALFVDDVFSASPDELGLSQSRIARLDEIRAGAGGDIVDMTSNKFEYIGSGLTIRGGDGNDTIWANKGDNFLFGDAGNDRIVGASGNDVIAGGVGNDRMHGGDGDDVFTFCDNWGEDIVEQLENGTVTLWFASGSLENWNASALTYTDGENRVAVKGVKADKVALKFGGAGEDDAARFAALSDAGAFEQFTSQKIFEESGQGFLAGL